MRILVCGDSYCITDPNYPELHWSEKLLNSSADFEVCNLASGGSSNALITLQLLQGLQLKPDFVIFSFTHDHRYEFDNDVDAVPLSLTAEELAHYQKQRYSTSVYKERNQEKIQLLNRWAVDAASTNMEKLKNYFYISFCLNTCQLENIPFCFSLGGFEYQQDYTNLIRSNYVKNYIVQHKDHELATNLWYHGTKPQPVFHVDNDNIQTLFAAECRDRILKAHDH